METPNMRNFRRIETVCDLTPKREDALLVGDDIFGVFDGAGSLTGFSDPQRGTGGKIAAIALSRKN